MTYPLAAATTIKNFTVSEGLLYALIGFVLVIVVLIVLMGFIYLLSYIVRKFSEKKKGEAATTAPAEQIAPELAPGSSGSVKLYNVDDRIAAMVMAIVADELQTPLNELRFISIKEVSEEEK